MRKILIYRIIPANKQRRNDYTLHSAAGAIMSYAVQYPLAIHGY